MGVEGEIALSVTKVGSVTVRGNNPILNRKLEIVLKAVSIGLHLVLYRAATLPKGVLPATPNP